MTESPKSAEIEDVLSSIRRLVSGGTAEAVPGPDSSQGNEPTKPFEAGPAPSDESETAPEAREGTHTNGVDTALVLTEDQRVATIGTADPVTEAARSWAADAEDDAAGATEEDTAPEAAAPENSDVEDGEAQTEPEAPRAPEPGGPFGGQRRSPFLSEALQAAQRQTLTATNNGTAEERPSAPFGPKSGFQEPTKELKGFGFGVARPPTPSQPPEASDTESAEDSTEPKPIFAHSFGLKPAAVPREPVSSDEANEPEPSAEEPDSPVVPQPQSSVADTVASAIPVEDDGADILSDGSDASTTLAPAPEALPLPAAPGPVEPAANLFGTSAAIVDEAMLRSIVTEIVHRELQGALGERVSENIRRLVHREIARALAARDLD